MKKFQLEIVQRIWWLISLQVSLILTHKSSLSTFLEKLCQRFCKKEFHHVIKLTPGMYKTFQKIHSIQNKKKFAKKYPGSPSNSNSRFLLSNRNLATKTIRQMEFLIIIVTGRVLDRGKKDRRSKNKAKFIWVIWAAGSARSEALQVLTPRRSGNIVSLIALKKS